MREKPANLAMRSGVLLEVKGETELQYKGRKIDYLFLDEQLVDKLGGTAELFHQVTYNNNRAVEPGLFSPFNWGKKFTFRNLNQNPDEVKIVTKTTSGWLKDCVGDSEEKNEIPSATILELGNNAFLTDENTIEIDAINAISSSEESEWFKRKKKLEELSGIYANESSSLDKTQTAELVRLLEECQAAATNGDEIAK